MSKTLIDFTVLSWADVAGARDWKRKQLWLVESNFDDSFAIEVGKREYRYIWILMERNDEAKHEMILEEFINQLPKKRDNLYF